MRKYFVFMIVTHHLIMDLIKVIVLIQPVTF